MMVPVGRIIIFRAVPRAELVRAMNYLAIPALFGPTLGPLVGGFITTYLHWRMIFFINVPIGIYGIYLASRHIANTHRPDPGPLDWFGFLLSASGAALLLMGLTLIDGALTSRGNAIAMCAVGAAMLALYVPYAPQDAAGARSELPEDSDLPRQRGRRLAVPDRPRRGAVPAAARAAGRARHERVPLGLITCASALGGAVSRSTATRAAPLRLSHGADLQRRVRRARDRRIRRVPSGHADLAIWTIVLVGGIFPALQFTSLNSMIYADISQADAGRATSLGSVVQQMSLGLGVTVAGLVLHLSHWLQGIRRWCGRTSGPRSSWSGCARSRRFRSRAGCRRAPATRSRAASGNDAPDGQKKQIRFVTDHEKNSGHPHGAGAQPHGCPLRAPGSSWGLRIPDLLPACH
jgi:hypothetical protein